MRLAVERAGGIVRRVERVRRSGGVYEVEVEGATAKEVQEEMK